MEHLLRVLADSAQGEDDSTFGGWEVSTSALGVTHVTARARDSREGAADAFADAQRLLQVVLDAGYVISTTAQVGAELDREDEQSWRGLVEVALRSS